MRLGPGREGYRLRLAATVDAQLRNAFAGWPDFEARWASIADLLITSGHIVGSEVDFRGRRHRLLSYDQHPEGHWPAIDLIFIVLVDELWVEFVEINIRSDVRP